MHIGYSRAKWAFYMLKFHNYRERFLESFVDQNRAIYLVKELDQIIHLIWKYIPALYDEWIFDFFPTSVRRIVPCESPRK